jgi:hypothetical protein
MLTIGILGPGRTVLRQSHSAYTAQTHIVFMGPFSETSTLPRPSMHPPAFCLDHRLSDWPGCVLELQCCKGVTLMPVRLLLSRHGDRTFKTLIRQLRCDRCGKSPAPIYLCASHFRGAKGMGAMADWAVELVGAPP